MALIWTPEKIAAVLNRLPMVAWDRGIRVPIPDTEEVVVTIYGWIDRDDNHYDFIEVTFVSWAEQVGWATSSARYSVAISHLLVGPDAPHHPCVRLADIPDLAGLVDRLVPWTAATDA